MRPAFEDPRLYTVKGRELPLSGEALVDLMRAVLAKGAPFRFRARGWSMLPFIQDGDVITVSPCRWEQLAIGDVVAFIKPAPRLLAVHRIIARRGNAWLIQGDNVRDEVDGVIVRQDILGRVTGVERNGRRVRGGLGIEARLIAWLQGTSRLQPLMNAWNLMRKWTDLPRRVARLLFRRRMPAVGDKDARSHLDVKKETQA